MLRYHCPKCGMMGWKITLRQEPGELRRFTDICCLNCGYEEYLQETWLPKEEL